MNEKSALFVKLFFDTKLFSACIWRMDSFAKACRHVYFKIYKKNCKNIKSKFAIKHGS